MELIIKHFDSLGSLRSFLETHEVNKVFTGEYLSSQDASKDAYNFRGTHSYEEAMDLFTNGWHTEAKILTDKLSTMKIDKGFREKMNYDVVGFQASVPRYLQGIPTNMINKKKVVQKQKIITITKNCSYLSVVSKEAIQKSNILALHLVRTLEAKGYKVNLNYLNVTAGKKQAIITKIKLKAANERLNISKLAFPLVHPSMMRRIMFRYREVLPELTDTEFVWGYGNSLVGEQVLHQNKRQVLKDNEYYIPSIIDEKFIEDFIKTL